MTVFLTTHYMEEAADADYVVILDKGKIAAEGTPLSLKTSTPATSLRFITPKKKKSRLWVFRTKKSGTRSECP